MTGKKNTNFLAERPLLIPLWMAAAFLLGALHQWPYGYYVLLRWITCGAAAFAAFCTGVYGSQSDAPAGGKQIWIGAAWGLAVVALLFNPIVPVHLTREIWQPIDMIVAGLFVVTGLAFRPGREKED